MTYVNLMLSVAASCDDRARPTCHGDINRRYVVFTSEVARFGRLDGRLPSGEANNAGVTSVSVASRSAWGQVVGHCSVPSLTGCRPCAAACARPAPAVSDGASPLSRRRASCPSTGRCLCFWPPAARRRGTSPPPPSSTSGRGECRHSRPCSRAGRLATTRCSPRPRK